MFSQTSTPAELPGSIAAAREVTSSSLSSIASSDSKVRSSPISPSSSSERQNSPSPPASSFFNTSRSSTRIRSRSTRSSSAGTICPLNLLPGNSTTIQSTGPSSSTASTSSIEILLFESEADGRDYASPPASL